MSVVRLCVIVPVVLLCYIDNGLVLRRALCVCSLFLSVVNGVGIVLCFCVCSLSLFLVACSCAVLLPRFCVIVRVRCSCSD